MAPAPAQFIINLLYITMVHSKRHKLVPNALIFQGLKIICTYTKYNKLVRLYKELDFYLKLSVRDSIVDKPSL